MSSAEPIVGLETVKPRGGPADAVFIAEDDPMFRRILQQQLENWGYRVNAVDDGAKAWELLQKDDAPGLLILDWIMPGMDGLELCRRIRGKQRPRYQYILLVTSRDDKQDVVKGLEAGADDYLTKPFDTGELRARLRVGQRILTLQDELIRAREELRFRATHDSLTGAWNRAAILDLLHRELQRSVRAHLSTGLLMLDLDHFKKINDNYGHLAGDTVLKEVAHRICDAVRSYDFVGRYGGEEFLLILSDCGQDDICTSAERVRLAVAKTPVVVGDTEIAVTASLGAATAAPGMTSEEDLILRADTAVYRAKSAGRNRTELAPSARCQVE